MKKQEPVNRSDTAGKSQMLRERPARRGRQLDGHNEDTKREFSRIGAESSPDSFLSFLTGSEFSKPANLSQRKRMINHLQRTYGNACVQRMIQAKSQFSRPCAGISMQTKPSVVNVELRPHRESDSVLRTFAPIYRQGKTPFIDASGNVRASDLVPANATTTGGQVEKIHQRFGVQGLAQTIRGLTLTRGTDFVASALQHASTALQHAAYPLMKMANVNTGTDEARFSAQTLVGEPARTQTIGETQEETVGSTVVSLLVRSRMGHRLPENLRDRLTGLTGDNLSDVRIHNDNAAHTAARLLGARAFTISRSIYFGNNEYQPLSSDGTRLIAHEVAHTVQQCGAKMPVLHNLRITPASSAQETEAERFADMAVRPDAKSLSMSFTHSAHAARIQRAISFTLSNGKFTTNTMGVYMEEDRFMIGPKKTPLFKWSADVTIKGNPEDRCTDFQVGPLQVISDYEHIVQWGAGTDSTRRIRSLPFLPIRDAFGSGSPWMYEPHVKNFKRCGDKQTVHVEDSPKSPWHPWTNPKQGRTENQGKFHYKIAFVAYLSARDKMRGTTDEAFTALGHVHWDTSIDGSFDATKPLGPSRVSYEGGAVNLSSVHEGQDEEYPPMHGGPIARESSKSIDT